MYCIKCGNEISESAKSCRNCSEKIDGQSNFERIQQDVEIIDE